MPREIKARKQRQSNPKPKISAQLPATKKSSPFAPIPPSRATKKAIYKQTSPFPLPTPRVLPSTPLSLPLGITH
jgi:hypothetical protein